MRRRGKAIQKVRSNFSNLAEISRAPLRSDSVRRASDDTVPPGKPSSVVDEQRVRVGRAAAPAPAPARRKVPEQDAGRPAQVSALEDALALVDALPPEHLLVLASRVSALLAARTPAARASRLCESDWHGAASIVLNEFGVAVLPLVALKKQSFAASFHRGVETAEKYMESFGDLTRAQRARTRVMLCRVVVRWMQRCRVPVSTKSFAQNLSNLPTAVDTAFPGYKRSGFLHVLASRG